MTIARANLRKGFPSSRRRSGEALFSVLPMERVIEVYRLPEGDRYREIHVSFSDEDLARSSLPNLRVQLGELFAGF